MTEKEIFAIRYRGALTKIASGLRQLHGIVDDLERFEDPVADDLRFPVAEIQCGLDEICWTAGEEKKKSLNIGDFVKLNERLFGDKED